MFAINNYIVFYYYRSIIDALAARGHKVSVLFGGRREDNIDRPDFKAVVEYRNKAKNFEYDWMMPRSDSQAAALTLIRAIQSYRRYLRVKDQSHFYLVRSSYYLPLYLRWLIMVPGVNSIIKSDAFGKFLIRREQKILPDKKITEHLATLAPDVFLSTLGNLRMDSGDIEYLKAARSLKIPTMAPVLSWDNLTTKGFISIIPDRLLVWNETQVEEAQEHHGVSRHSTAITGAPLFDDWFEAKGRVSDRESFCRTYGLDPQKPILLYLGSSRNINPDETELIKKLRTALDSSKDPQIKNIQILFRPHPKNHTLYKNMVVAGVTSLASSLPPLNSRQYFDFSYDTFYHSFATAGINTSSMIEAMILGLPVICYLDPSWEEKQSEAAHFRQFLENDTVEQVHNASEFEAVVKNLLKGIDGKKERREGFVRNYIRPLGLHQSAGEAVVKEIEKLCYE